jgi:hypothetical protein
MPSGKEIACELRQIADHYEGLADVELIRPRLEFNCLSSGKDKFIIAAKNVPRPSAKDYGKEGDPYAFIRVNHAGNHIDVQAFAMRSDICKIIKPAQPAEYDCEPILSIEEQAEIEA